MKLFQRNIDNKGRLMRGFMALALFVGAGFAARFSIGLAIGLIASGGFALFEALRGWCALRACGIKTKV